MKQLTLKELQDMSLVIFKEVHKFCEQAGIRYSMAYGTLIGAARHKGFIPWDDDIDIIMPRPDYERFLAEFRSERFKIAVPAKDSYLAFARVYDDRLTACFAKRPWKSGDRPGVWIDVFPVDCVSPDDAAYGIQLARTKALYKKQLAVRKKYATLADIKMVKFGSVLCMVPKTAYKRIRYAGVSAAGINRRYNRELTACEWGSTPCWAQLSCRDTEYPARYPVEWFDHLALLPFEGCEFWAVSEWDAMLRAEYGDYMVVPEHHEQHTLCDNVIVWK